MNTLPRPKKYFIEKTRKSDGKVFTDGFYTKKDLDRYMSLNYSQYNFKQL